MRSVKIQKTATDSYGIVIFHDAKTAAKTLKIKFHIIAGHNRALKGYDWHEDRIELTNATRKKFTDLNDNKLTTVSVMDLCSLAETGVRLKALVHDTFTRK